MVPFAGPLPPPPGFLSDVLGILLLLPPTRAIARRQLPRLAQWRLRRRTGRGGGGRGPPPPAGLAPGHLGPGRGRRPPAPAARPRPVRLTRTGHPDRACGRFR